MYGLGCGVVGWLGATVLETGQWLGRTRPAKAPKAGNFVLFEGGFLNILDALAFLLRLSYHGCYGLGSIFGYLIWRDFLLRPLRSLRIGNKGADAWKRICRGRGQ